MPKHRTPLTPKERSFIKPLIANKFNRTEAVMQSDYEVKDKNSAQVLGSQLMNKPHIQKAIQDELNKQGVTEEYLVLKAKQIIDRGLETENIENRGYSVTDARLMIVESLKLKNAYPERVKKSMNLNVSKDMSLENTSEIITKLSELTETTKKLIDDINR